MRNNIRRTSSSTVSAAATWATATLAIFAIGSIGCTTPTTETNVWKNQSYTGGPMKEIAVFAFRLNETDRRTLEDQFASALRGYGVHATPSYAIFPEELPDPASVRGTLQGSGYDGALVSTLRGVSEQVMVTPDADWPGGFTSAYTGPGGPVYGQTDQYVKFETSMWSPSSGKMVWSTVTETENPMSKHDFESSLTRTVVPSLAKEGLIPPKSPGRQSVSVAR
ncbi:MAG: hypothetical protein ABSC94_06225 [Polyangiaceae bacterium]|jgi:hypothetical protein